MVTVCEFESKNVHQNNVIFIEFFSDLYSHAIIATPEDLTVVTGVRVVDGIAVAPVEETGE